ncbi:MAG: hypothetical protein J6C81_05365 [Muribaculaceae bacterium]|nr:hypothetical protein [Muribaculaceae bacterium]
MDNKSNNDLQTQSESAAIIHGKPGFRIGILGNYADSDETRFMITPEACGVIIEQGYQVCMEEGASVDISFTDLNYAEYGVEIVSRDQALQADMVLCYEPIRTPEIEKMRKGAALLCMMGHSFFERDFIEALNRRHILSVSLDNIVSHNDEPVFSNIVSEIDGRAAIMYAQDYLSFLGGGKGVLLAGVAGINPCEILIIGQGTRVASAALAGISQGAIVTVMDNDVSMLQTIKEICSDRVQTLSIHPRVLASKVKSADVIIIDDCTRPFELPADLRSSMKETVYLLDLTQQSPSLAVPRTVAMGLSNVLINFFDEMSIKGGIDAMVASTAGLQVGIITYEGKLTDKLIASFLGLPCVDISVLLSASN